MDWIGLDMFHSLFVKTDSTQSLSNKCKTINKDLLVASLLLLTIMKMSVNGSFWNWYLRGEKISSHTQKTAEARTYFNQQFTLLYIE